MDKITSYFSEAYDELMHKVTWPTWAELQDSAIVVLITAVLLSGTIALLDIALRAGSTQLYKILIP